MASRDADGERSGWQRAEDEQQGEAVVREQYPYLALTVWCAEGYDEAAWRGDLSRWRHYFAEGAGYMQGDAAVRHADGAYTFHGRSDEVCGIAAHPHACRARRRTPSPWTAAVY